MAVCFLTVVCPSGSQKRNVVPIGLCPQTAADSDPHSWLFFVFQVLSVIKCFYSKRVIGDTWCVCGSVRTMTWRKITSHMASELLLCDVELSAAERSNVARRLIGLLVFVWRYNDRQIVFKWDHAELVQNSLNSGLVVGISMGQEEKVDPRSTPCCDFNISTCTGRFFYWHHGKRK